MKKHYLQTGFTLVELAIVMVVLGLLVSGVLVGQQLIEQARIRKVLSQLTQYDQALNTFRLKYDYLPGDFPHAYRFFGSFSSCTDEFSLTLDGTGCNGNGNGMIALSDDEESELFLAWAHLSNAGLVAGNYTGFPIHIDLSSSANNVLAQGGINAPFIGSHKAILIIHTYQRKAAYMPAVLNLGNPSGPGFTVSEAYAIDSKRDDGNPNTGNVTSRNANPLPDCITGDTYNFGSSGLICVLHILAQ